MNITEFQDRCERLGMMLDHLPRGYERYAFDLQQRILSMLDEVEILGRVSSDIRRKLGALELHVSSILGEDYEHEKYRDEG